MVLGSFYIKAIQLFFDNHFTTPGLLKDLKEEKISACGMVNPSWKNLKSDTHTKHGGL